MKKLFSIALCICLTLAAVFTAVPSFAKAEDDANTDAVVNYLTEYSEGVYIKNTTITADSLNVNSAEHFHGKASSSTRRTIYTPGRLYMSNGDDGKINSGYRDAGVNMEHFTIVNGVDTDDYTVYNTSIREFFVLLDELYTGGKWDSHTIEFEDADPIDGYKMSLVGVEEEYIETWEHFVAPMWDPDTQIVTFTSVVVYEANKELNLLLYGTTAAISEETLFSKAVISKPEEPVAGETEEPYSYTFEAKVFSENGTQALNGVDWTVTGDCPYWGYDGTKGQQFGSKNNPAKSVILTASAFTSNIDTITLNASMASSGSGKLAVYVGETQLGNVISLTTTATDYEFKATTPVSGTVRIEFTNSARAMYLKSIGITFAASASESTCEHEYSIATVAPTCTVGGKTVEICNICGEEGNVHTTTNKTGHTFSEWDVTTAPTCTTVGESTRVCKDCGHEETEPVDKIAHNFVGDVCSVCGEPKAGTWELVTDVSELAAGKQIIIVAKDYNYALSTTQNGNNRGQAAVTKVGNTVTVGSDVQIITLEAGTKTGTFAFNVGNGYLYAASSSSNYLRTEENLSDNSSWTIEIADGVATIVAQGTNTRNTMQYNSGSSLFACYSSASQKAICLYKLVEG